MKRLLSLASILILTASAWGAGKQLVNVDKNGLALQGYDPVAFFNNKQPVKGEAKFQTAYNGGRYQFASESNKKAFEAEPARYEPQFGGFCAYAASRGYTAKIDPRAFQVLNGRLLLQYSYEARDKFNQDPQGNLKRADQNWPSLIEKYGR